MSKKKKNDLYLTVNERPLFGRWNSIHQTKKDKADSRQQKKQDLKKELDEIE